MPAKFARRRRRLKYNLILVSLLVDNVSVIILYQVFVVVTLGFDCLESVGCSEYLSSCLFLKYITITLDAGIAQWGV